jgi:ABC-type uncharacterized transport system permease subunit
MELNERMKEIVITNLLLGKKLFIILCKQIARKEEVGSWFEVGIHIALLASVVFFILYFFLLFVF